MRVAASRIPLLFGQAFLSGRQVCSIVVFGLLFAASVSLSGCWGPSGPQIVAADGVVTYRGKPLSGATVLFSTEGGPPAVGQTDSDGRFMFNTQGQQGAIVGPGGIAISAVVQDRDLTEAEVDLAGEAYTRLMDSISRSVIPKRYGHPRTSGLTATVSEDPEQNHFTFELK
jgi:hypothetical protein